MYNEKVKMEWIEKKSGESKINKYQLPGMFKKLTPFEESLDKDLSCFNESEIIDMLEEVNYKSLAAIKVDLSYLRSYTDWMIEQGNVPDGVNHYFAEILSQDTLSKISEQKPIMTRRQVLSWCVRVLNPSDAVILLGLFEGICGKNFCELLNIKKGDVNEENSTILLYGRDEPLKISVTLCSYISDSIDTTRYMTYGKFTRNTPLIPSEFAIKELSNASQGASDFRRGRRVYTRIKIIFDYLGISKTTNANDITMSGIADFVLNASGQRGINWRDYIVTEECRKKIRQRYNKEIEPFQFILQYGDCLD